MAQERYKGRVKNLEDIGPLCKGHRGNNLLLFDSIRHDPNPPEDNHCYIKIEVECSGCLKRCEIEDVIGSSKGILCKECVEKDKPTTLQ